LGEDEFGSKGEKELREDQGRWDKKYREKKFELNQDANSILKKNIRLFPKEKALDVAAGEGRNAIFLARNGFNVEAVDISKIGLSRARKLAKAQGVKIKTIMADLDNYSIPSGHYDLIIDFYFLDRRLIPKIKKGLKKGGMVVFETYTSEQKDLGTGGPKGLKYLLRPNELLRLFQDFRILFYREGVFREGGKRRAIASLIAQNQVIGQRL
jgi:2-polyprenyl-3-methyl-5-hydroxy-6-metoxy-1,4-benzoquinol methylase